MFQQVSVATVTSAWLILYVQAQELPGLSIYLTTLTSTPGKYSVQMF